MNIEIEAKFIGVDVVALRELLQGHGTLVQKQYMQTSAIFDYPDFSLEKKGAWIRIRKEHDKVALSFKQLKSRTLHGTIEHSVSVSSFEETCDIFLNLGLVKISHQEKKREIWHCGNCEVVIDEWPWIPPFVEIEGPDEHSVKTVAAQLGFKWEEAMFGSVENIYMNYYDVTEHEVDHWPKIEFTPVPVWLEKKKKA